MAKLYQVCCPKCNNKTDFYRYGRNEHGHQKYRCKCCGFQWAPEASREIGRPRMKEYPARRKILCKRFSTKSRMALENRADSGLDPLITESHGGQNGMCAGTA